MLLSFWLSLAFAADPAFRFDFSKNFILGDLGEGPLLQALARHAKALDACLVGVEPIFDAAGHVPVADLRVDRDGRLEQFGFSSPALEEVNRCLARALERAKLPPGRDVRMGIVELRRATPAAPITQGAYRTKADGLSLELTARPEAVGSGWAVAAKVVVTPDDTEHGIGAEALQLIPTLYRPDGSSSHISAWSIGDQNPAPCVPAGRAYPMEASTGPSDLAQPGEVMRVLVVLTHGTCQDAMQTRTVAGAVELWVPRAGQPTLTLWAPSQLDATPEPFEDVRQRALFGP